MEYKVLIVKNRYKKTLDFSRGLVWFPKHTPLNVVVTEIETDFDIKFKKAGNATYKGVVADGYQDELRKIVPEGKYNCVCLVYGNDAPDIRVSVAENVPLYQDTDIVQVIKVTDKGLTFNHELFHIFFKKLSRYGIKFKDPMDSVIVDGKVQAYYHDKDLEAEQSNRTIALASLKPYWSTIAQLGKKKPIDQPVPQTGKYKYFKDSEIVGLKPELVSMLDTARGIAGTSFVITSGYRTPEHNKKVGGVPNSSHLKGLAVDLACTDNLKRTKILLGLLTCGVPTFIEICKAHIHIDMDSSIHPMGHTMWANDD